MSEDPVAAVAAGIEAVVEALKRPELQPDPTLGDQRPALVEATRTFRERVLPNLRAALPPHDIQEALRVADGVAGIAERLAATLCASGSKPTAQQVLQETQRQLPPGDYLAELGAGSRDIEGFARLSYARFLWNDGDRKKAMATAEEVMRTSNERALKDGAQQLLSAPQPLTSAPSLFTMNGFGTMLYGKADPRPDGWYTATLYLVALFIPIIPLGRYIVRDAGGRSWNFAGKVPLTKGQRWYRRGVGLAVLAAIAFAWVSSWLESPSHQVAVAIEAARKNPSVQAWEDVLVRFENQLYGDELAPAADEWTRLRIAEVKEPFTRASVEPVKRMVLRFQRIGDAARAKAAPVLAQKLVAWQRQLPSERREDLDAQLTLLDLARGVQPGKQELADEQNRIRRVIASQLATDWPLRALAKYSEIGDEEALLAGGKVLESLGDVGTLFSEEAPMLTSFLAKATAKPQLAAVVKLTRERIAAADALLKAQGRAELLSSADEKRLAADAQRYPLDQAITVELAKVIRARGDAAGALAALDKFGPPGKMIGDAQLLSAFLLEQLGKPGEAEQRLAGYLDGRLARFIEAGSALESAAASLEKNLVDQARRGTLPPGLELQLKGQPEEKQQEIFSEWLRDELEKSATLTPLRERYRSLTGVVEASIALGTLKLQRANGANGDERAAILREAEETFLAVRADAEGSVRYHLGLGQVFHRLGKAEEGDKELMSVAKNAPPEDKLEVCAIYRELGLVKQARELCEQVHRTASGKFADAAAAMLALLASSRDQTESWLSKIAKPTPAQQAQLAEMRGSRLLDESKSAEADREFVKALDFHLKSASSSAVAANNTAVAYGYRFAATGDLAHLDKAVTYFEKAASLERDNAIVLGNAASAHIERMTLTLVAKYVQLKQLKLRTWEATRVLFALLNGPLRDEVKEAIRRSPSFQRGMELSRQQEVLAPNNVDAYDRQLDWYDALDDLEALKTLASRVQRVPRFDLTHHEEAQARLRDGKKYDAETRASTEARLKMLESMRAGLSGPTLAVHHLLVCQWRDTRARVDDDLDRLRESREACKNAQQLWPALALEGHNAMSDAELTILEAAKRQAPLQARLDGERWMHDTLVSAWREARKSHEVGEALAAAEGIRDADKRLAALNKDHWGLNAWALADLSHDTAFRDRLVAEIPRDTIRLRMEILERIGPGTPHLTATKELWSAAFGAP